MNRNQADLARWRLESSVPTLRTDALSCLISAPTHEPDLHLPDGLRGDSVVRRVGGIDEEGEETGLALLRPILILQANTLGASPRTAPFQTPAISCLVPCADVHPTQAHVGTSSSEPQEAHHELMRKSCGRYQDEHGSARHGNLV